jgi:uncharacterized protein (DUF885 family)
MKTIMFLLLVNPYTAQAEPALVLLENSPHQVYEFPNPSPTRSGNSSENLSRQIDSLNQAYDEAYLQLNPYWATVRGDNRYNNRLAVTIDTAYRAQEKALYTQYLQRAAKVDRQQLVGPALVSYDTFVYGLKQDLRSLDFGRHLLPLNLRDNTPAFFAQMGSGAGAHPFHTVKDYDDFLQRMGDFERWTKTAIANMRQGMAQGIVQPKVIMEAILPQLQAMLVQDVKQSLFYKPIASLPSGFSETDQHRLTLAYTQAIEQQIIPTYRKLHDFIRQEYLPKCRSTVGLSAIPGGKDQYAYLIATFTTTTLSADEIYALGMAEIKRIRAEMESVKKQVGFQGDLQAFFKFVDTDSQFYPFKSEEQVLQAYRDIHKRMEPQLRKLFNLVPKASFEVRAVEAFRAATTSHRYERPSADGSRPGVFYVPIPVLSKYYSYQMEDLFLHEAIPGHHYQIALQQEQTNLPKFRQFGSFGAYTEGWGLYAESLGKELGLYQDPYQYFGRLGGDMHRALRLVLDVGIHLKGWTREQAIQFSLENEPSSYERVVSEVDRYISQPGQALSYKIGELKIRQLRAKAEKALRNQFDIKAFHDEILKDGALPLAVLETKIDRWINRISSGKNASRDSDK